MGGSGGAARPPLRRSLITCSYMVWRSIFNKGPPPTIMVTLWKIFQQKKNSQNGSQMTHGPLGAIPGLTRPSRIQPRRRERPKSAPNGPKQTSGTPENLPESNPGKPPSRLARSSPALSGGWGEEPVACASRLPSTVQLLKAAAVGDLSGIECALASGADVNAVYDPSM